MIDVATPIGFGLGLFVISSLLGVIAVRRLIMIAEAKHELKVGSATYLRIISRWFLVLIWVAGTWFAATVLGDWWASGDLDQAIERGWRRLHVLIILLDAFTD